MPKGANITFRGFGVPPLPLALLEVVELLPLPLLLFPPAALLATAGELLPAFSLAPTSVAPLGEFGDVCSGELAFDAAALKAAAASAKCSLVNGRTAGCSRKSMDAHTVSPCTKNVNENDKCCELKVNANKMSDCFGTGKFYNLQKLI